MPPRRTLTQHRRRSLVARRRRRARSRRKEKQHQAPLIKAEVFAGGESMHRGFPLPVRARASQPPSKSPPQIARPRPPRAARSRALEKRNLPQGQVVELILLLPAGLPSGRRPPHRGVVAQERNRAPRPCSQMRPRGPRPLWTGRAVSGSPT
jgi:hypothetical protein